MVGFYLVGLVEVLLRAVEVAELELALGDALVCVRELGVLLVKGSLVVVECLLEEG